MNVSRFVGANGDLIKPIQCEVELVTPAFLGGADQSAELRSPPFKAALRWWWRVLFGARYGADIFQKESELFGSTDGASKVRIEVSGVVTVESSDSNARNFKGRSYGQFNLDIIDYLAYGPCQRDKVLKKNVYRTYLAPNSSFLLNVYAPREKEAEIGSCLQALFAFGGVGSRSRNGLGSLRLIKSSSEKKYNVNWQENKKLQGFPTISAASMLFETSKQDYDKWQDALSEIGIAYWEARMSLEESGVYDKRGLLASPIEIQGRTVVAGRSPKQFIIHVGKTHNGKFVGRILTLPIKTANQTKYNEMLMQMYKSLSSKLKKVDISKFLEVSK
jgi:CRISPR-associated protein Cmr1